MKLDWNSIKAELLCSPNKIEIFEKASEAHYDTVLDIDANNACEVAVIGGVIWIVFNFKES